MEYETVERDFVLRSIKIIEQYEEHVRPRVPTEQYYDVTLLLNCLLGLIVLPFEHSKRKQGNPQFPEIFSGDDTPISELSKDWGIGELKIERFKINGKNIDGNEITLRKIVAMFRHSMAHSQFGDGGKIQKPDGLSVSYKPAEHDAIKSVILEVNFVNEYKQQVDFRAKIPVGSLKLFAISLANAFITTKN